MRTIYRDMDRLALSGVPVAGKRGLGYAMTAPVTLPPLNLTLTELEALHVGLGVVAEVADDELRRAAKALAAKVDAVLPEDRSAPPSGWGIATHPFQEAAGGFRHMPQIRKAIRSRQKLQITYADTHGNRSNRVIRPLKLDYWGRVWTTSCWCELDQAFREFRIDRIRDLKVMAELFVEEQGKSLADLTAQSDH